MESKIVSIAFTDIDSDHPTPQPQNACELFNEFCKLKEIHKENIVSVNYTRFDNKSSILLVYEGEN